MSVFHETVADELITNNISKCFLLPIFAAKAQLVVHSDDLRGEGWGGGGGDGVT